MLPFELTKDTPYLALSGELWSVFYEYFNRNWPCYKGFLLYVLVAICSFSQAWLHVGLDKKKYQMIKPSYIKIYILDHWSRIW